MAGCKGVTGRCAICRMKAHLTSKSSAVQVGQGTEKDSPASAPALDCTCSTADHLTSVRQLQPPASQAHVHFQGSDLDGERWRANKIKFCCDIPHSKI
eukprot:2394953-Rhodomonas_salina.1